MSEAFDPDRFIQAQDQVLTQVRRELREGRKQSHWMWFVFPQLSGLGHSATARRYALDSLATAQAYLRHPVLGARLIEWTRLVNQVEGRTAHQIFGSPDDLKFHSCMTLFARARPDAAEFTDALGKYFAGSPDRLTVEKLAPPLS